MAYFTFSTGSEIKSTRRPCRTVGRNVSLQYKSKLLKSYDMITNHAHGLQSSQYPSAAAPGVAAAPAAAAPVAAVSAEIVHGEWRVET
jgi:hypothetical protein